MREGGSRSTLIAGLLAGIPIGGQRYREPAKRRPWHRAGGADVCRLTGWDVEANRSALIVRTSQTLDDAAISDHEAHYFGYYRALDPRVPLSERYTERRLLSCSEHLSCADVSRSEFFQDFMRPKCDVRWTAGGRVFRRDAVYVDFALERVRSRSDFSEEEIDRLNAIAPHLQRALAVHMELARQQLHAALTQDALDLLDHGVVILDGSRRLVQSNRRGEALLRQGRYLKSHYGRVTAVSPGSSSDFEAAASRVVASGRPASLQLSPRGPQALGEPHCNVLLTRHRSPAAAGLSGTCHLLCVLSLPGRQRLPSGVQLMELYGLTAAQARVARSLLAGRTPEETAEDLAVGMSTVRTHIRALLQKTGTRNQAGLCTLIAGLPSLRYGEAD